MKFLAYLMALIALIALAGTVSAVCYNDYIADVASVQLKGDTDSYWDESISANTGESIDVMAEIYLNEYEYMSDNPCDYSWVTVKAKVYGYDNGWKIVKTLSEKTETVFLFDSEEFYWYNAFITSSNYEKYKIEVETTTEGSSWKGFNTGYVYIEGSNGDCSDIRISAHDISVDEKQSNVYEQFDIKNLSDSKFTVYEFDAYDNSTYFTLKENDWPSSLSAGQTGQLEVSINTIDVSGDRDGTAFMRLRGRFDNGTDCYFDDIQEEFTVFVQDTVLEDCDRIQWNFDSFHMDEGDTEYKDFTVKNNSNTDFRIDSIDIHESSEYFNASLYYKDSLIDSYDDGKVTIKVVAQDVSYNRSGTVRVDVDGHFVGGTSCDYTDTFTVFVDDVQGEGNCDAIELVNKTLYVKENSTENETMQLRNTEDQRFYIDAIDAFDYDSYFDITDTSHDSSISANGNSNVQLKIVARSVSAEKSGIGYIKVKGHFADGSTCEYSDIGNLSFTVRITNQETSLCNDLSIDTHSVTLDAGKTVYENFYLKNDSSQNFYVDTFSVSDNSSYFESSAYNQENKALAGDNAKLTAKIRALSSTKDRQGTATIKVSGHFTDGKTCSYSEIGSESFTVNVNGSEEENANCSDFTLNIPSTKTISGTESFSISIDNPLDEAGTIELSGDNLSISPSSIDIAANSFITKTIEVKLLTGNSSKLFYSVDLGNCNISDKYTTINKASVEELEIVSYPSVKTVKGSTAVSITAKNNSDSTKTVEVSLTGFPSSWNIEEKTVSLGAGESKTISLNVSPTSTGNFNGQLLLKADGIETTKDIQLKVESAATESNINLQVQVGTPLQGNTYSVIVKVINDSSERIYGNLSFDVPSNWDVSGETSVTVSANSSQDFTLSVTPNEDLTAEKLSAAILTLDDGSEVSEIIAFPPKFGFGSSALVVLAQNWVAVILIIIIVVLLYALIRRA